MIRRLTSALRAPTVRWLLRSYLLFGLVLIAAAIAMFVLHITGEVDEQAEVTTRLIGRLLGDTLFSDTPEEQKFQQWAYLREAIDDVAFPFVVTDTAGRPFLWNARQTGVALREDEDLDALLHVDVENPRDPRLVRLLELVRDYDAQSNPIALEAPTGAVLGYLHFGDSRLSRKLLWMPFLEGVLIVAFMGVALLAFRNMKRSEQRSIWVGMAKETAHQLGTPLTSLNGWLALLTDEGQQASASIDRGQVLDELRSDVVRLSKVSARFSQIGSRPKLTLGRVDQLVRQVCDYFERRLPHLGKQVRIVATVEEVPLAPINVELLDWAFENLIKNALDASDKGRGVVEVICRHREAEDQIEVLVRDDGKGMTPAVQRRVFEPGFSTKQRGWGMGLALVHRIVVEYHGGHVLVDQSVPGEGTTMRVLLQVR